MKPARPSLYVRPRRQWQRAALDLGMALGVAALLVLFNLLLDYSRPMKEFFARPESQRVLGIAVNALLVWLACLLGIAFVRWRSAARRQREAEDILSSISPDALLVVSGDRTIHLCNASVRGLFGFAEEEVIGRKTELLYFDRRQSTSHPREIYEALERDGFHVGNATGRRKDGSTFPLEIISAELLSGRGAVLLLRDISERLRRQEEQRRLEQRAQQAERLESLGVLAGGVAGDFGNLLMVIQGHADLALMSAPPDGQVRESALEIIRAAERARELCRSLIAFSGRDETERAALGLSEVTQEAVRGLAAALPRSVKLELALAGDLPSVRADRAQIQRVVANLVRNAAESLGEREGVVRVSTGVRDWPEAADASAGAPPAAGRYVYLEVADNGRGMDEAVRQRIFDPFFTTKPTGHGLGLAATLGIVRAHGGGIAVRSQPGAGASFTVLLPPA
jgi:PAS domain S-box-containing protein